MSAPRRRFARALVHVTLAALALALLWQANTRPDLARSRTRPPTITSRATLPANR